MTIERKKKGGLGESKRHHSKVEKGRDRVLRRTRIIDNIPLITMYCLGTLIVWQLGWIFGLTYVVLCIFSLFWFMRFICSHCLAPRVGKCASGIGNMSHQLFGRRDHRVFATNFKRHIGVQFPPWFIPPIVAVYLLWIDYSLFMLVLLIVFCIVAFGILPNVSKHEACSECPMRNTCPYAKIR